MKVFDSGKLLARPSTAVALLGAAGVLLVALAVITDVLMRWLFNLPILAVDDLGRYVMAVVVSSFFPAGLARDQFVTIRFLGKGLGVRARLWLDCFGAIATLLAFAIFAWRIFDYAIEVSRSGLATTVLELPQGPWWWLVATLFAVCVPIQVVVVIERLARAISGAPPDAAAGGEQQAESVA
ncbi:MAG: hypothetical protein A3G25_20020 [Betaproteobacteria bacterium RIFCSPLOWO2_12_FULL_63_13]|nr:MAG: hypothetical protein A3H32_15865 [Betaproteobacteria bacterium RIFCSPLOWO2_02_FULL_63_19]OGA45028.1 MAG: hypothetical protein A3G25_20020 [Betaproteobacteria bacterium RIFCSPLOWO2_12_FULL_63_13]